MNAAVSHAGDEKTTVGQQDVARYEQPAANGPMLGVARPFANRNWPVGVKKTAVGRVRRRKYWSSN